ncbi:DUF1206 domain-containing protein [Halobacillus locisalis]|uniref:DUF1206 domain-containing protein n=1 Tax=Halobacillus locisalis TaxID=220753 RepID=A0A838CWK9_9BACI|nr:DUF1206 domain-containing protein [Halobacillus locisalis]MBA2176350.1 DUF1206 domain-containing protein [Halobacillus locisalis]
MSATMQAKASSEKAKEEIKPWIRRIGRFGYMSKGVVYALVGILTFMAAIGVGGKMTGTSGMFRTVASVPFGEFLLWVIGIGVIGYIMWSFIKAIKDPHNKGKDAKGIVTRIGYAVSGLIYTGLAVNAIQIAMHSGSGGGNTNQTISAMLLGQPFGRFLVGALGLIVIGYGIKEFYQGFTENFMSKFQTSEMDQHERKIARNAGKMGLMARGIVLGMIGFFFTLTAWTADPSETKGLDGALSELARQPYGSYLLGAVALGFILYGIYQMARGRYQHMSFGK